MTYEYTPENRHAIGNGYLREEYRCVECNHIFDEDDRDDPCPDCGGKLEEVDSSALHANPKHEGAA